MATAKQCELDCQSQIEERKSDIDSGGVLPSWRLVFVIGSLCLGTFLVALDTTIISVAVPSIVTDFQAFDDVGWYGSAYLLTVTAFQPAFGSVYKTFNAKFTYLVSVLVFEGSFCTTIFFLFLTAR